MQKWEYCAVVSLRRFSYKPNPREPGLWQFTVNGIQTSPLQGSDANNEIAKIIAQLGEQGWEMTGTATIEEWRSHILYFKRLKS